MGHRPCSYAGSPKLSGIEPRTAHLTSDGLLPTSGEVLVEKVTSFIRQQLEAVHAEGKAPAESSVLDDR